MSIGKLSCQIDEFLKLIRHAQELYGQSQETEVTTNNQTQDILHALELNDYSYRDRSFIASRLATVRKQRREAKDLFSQTKPIVDWATNNQKAIRTLENLLGELRKVERALENRIYARRTSIMEDIDGNREGDAV